jgi:hypothetical protein
MTDACVDSPLADWQEGVELTGEEQALADEFMELERAGAGPSIEGFLARMPGSAERLRPVLEGAQLFCAEVRRFRQEFPDVKLMHVLGVPMPRG